MKRRKWITLLLGVVTLLCLALGALVACSDKDDPKDPGEKTLLSITIETMPTKLEYEIGETVDTAGMKVVANFSDKTTQDVTNECTTTIGSNKITATTTSYYVKYVYNKVTKTARVDITVHKVEIQFTDLDASVYDTYKEPYKIAEESQADFVFVTSFNSSSMLVDACLELTGTEASGTFSYSERNDKPEDVNLDNGLGYKLAYMQGTYSTSDGQMTFKTQSVQRIRTARLDEVTVDVAEVVKDGQNIVGLNFGSMVKPSVVFGWGKTKSTDFVEGNAQNYNLDPYICYFSVVKNHELPSDIRFYHAPVQSISVERAPDKTAYEYGDSLVTAGLKLKVTYAAGAPAFVEDGFTVDKTEPLTDADTQVIVTYGGQTTSFAITVSAPPAQGLQAIELTDAPTSFFYIDEGTQTVAEAVAASGMTVTAKYADKADATVSDWTVQDGQRVLDATVTSYVVSYTEDGVTKTKTVDVTVSLATPAQIARTSNADLVFYTYFTKSSNVANGVLELNYAEGSTDQGTFVYTMQAGATKVNTLKGSFSVSEGVISFGSIVMKQVVGTSGMTTNADETARVVTENGKIVYLDFGCVAGNVADVTQEGFWGYTASKSADCKSSAAETVGAPAYMIYMIRVENGDLKDLRVDY